MTLGVRYLEVDGTSVGLSQSKGKKISSGFLGQDGSLPPLFFGQQFCLICVTLASPLKTCFPRP